MAKKYENHNDPVISLADLTAVADTVKAGAAADKETLDGLSAQVEGLADTTELDALIKTEDHAAASREEILKLFPLKPVYLCDGKTFKSKINKMQDFRSATSLNFVNDLPSEDAQLTDVSRDNDSSVVAWIENGTLYVSGYGAKIYANENCENMFSNLTFIESIDLKLLDTSKTNSMKNMFMSSDGLKNVDISKFNTDNVTNMESMFYYCSGLTSLNLQSFNTSQVTNMANMFTYCKTLSELNLENFTTSNVKSMSKMFNGCEGLQTLVLGDFRNEQVKNMGLMFYGCHSLLRLDLSNFNTDNATNMSYMFDGCRQLTGLDLTGFNTENVENMESMFSSCPQLAELDLSNFNTDQVTNMNVMFSSCSNLQAIYADDWTGNPNISSATNVFKGCSKLPGYSEEKVSGEYAKLQPDGYFTAKEG